MTGAPSAESARHTELSERLAAVQARIGAACHAAGRDRAELTLVVVTKFFPASDVVTLAGLGVGDIGENRDQEAAPKIARARADGAQVVFHFIGQVQSNKARSVATYADVVHTVDRPKLVRALDQASAAAGRRLRVLVQVDLDPSRPLDASDWTRGGAPPDGIPLLAAAVAASDHLDLTGVMAVAPLGADPDAAFARLAGVAERVRADHPSATWISAGMSGDLEAAIRHGATHLRVGTAILGSRPPLR